MRLREPPREPLGESLLTASSQAFFEPSTPLQFDGAVTVEDNLIAAEVLWTPEDDNDTMDREDMFMNFPELVSV